MNLCHLITHVAQKGFISTKRCFSTYWYHYNHSNEVSQSHHLDKIQNEEELYVVATIVQIESPKMFLRIVIIFDI